MSNTALEDFRSNELQFYTAKKQSSSDILEAQKKDTEEGEGGVIESLHRTKELGYQIKQALEDGDLEPSEIKEGIRQRTIESEIVPMFCGTAFKNKGVQAMLDAVIDYLPSPTDIPPVQGVLESGDESKRDESDDEFFAGLAFKIMTDPYVGQLIFFRVYSGVIKSGDFIYNPVKSKKERIIKIG